MHNAITNMAMYKLYDSKGGYIGTFPSWQAADNYRTARNCRHYKIIRISYCVSCWSTKYKPFKQTKL